MSTQYLPFSALSFHAVAMPGLQLPGRPTVIRDTQFGGPEDRSDRRMILHVAQLEELLKVAKESMTSRVVIHHFGVRVQLLEAQGGHRYEHCTFVGSKLEAESALGIRK